MEGEKMKEKLQENNDEEESEEEKLEKFYALIRSTKNVRDRLANTKDKADKKHDSIEKDKGIWKPTFQPQDFIDDCQQLGFRGTHDSSIPSLPSTSAKHHDVVQVADKQPPHATSPEVPPPHVENDGDDEKANDNLDLNLSL